MHRQRSRHGWRHEMRGRGRHRVRRGDVRSAILALLDDRPMHGYEIIQELDERTGGRWRPSAGSIYPTLQLLEDEELVSAEEADGKRVGFEGVAMMKLSDGKIAEYREVANVGPAFVELGFAPERTAKILAKEGTHLRKQPEFRRHLA